MCVHLTDKHSTNQLSFFFSLYLPQKIPLLIAIKKIRLYIYFLISNIFFLFLPSPPSLSCEACDKNKFDFFFNLWWIAHFLGFFLFILISFRGNFKNAHFNWVELILMKKYWKRWGSQVMKVFELKKESAMYLGTF